MRIGVTGHRNLVDLEENEFLALNEHSKNIKLQQLHTSIEKEINKLKGYNNYIVISPLADGADRIVAIKAIEILNAHIVVPIPFTEDIYKDSFFNNESKEEFDHILNNKNIKVKKIENFRDYEDVGKYVVDNCDLLFAIWDGKKAKGKGGTAEIIKYAKEKSKKIIYLSPDGKKISYL